MLITFCSTWNLVWAGLVWRGMWITFFGFVKMSVEGCTRHNPPPRYFTPTLYPTIPHFLPHFTCGNSNNEDFSPLLISGRPYFYYIYFPAKKVIERTKQGSERSEPMVVYYISFLTDIMYRSTKEGVVF